MRYFHLNIANYLITIESAENGPNLNIAPKFRKFIFEGVDDGSPTINIRVCNGSTDLPSFARCVFEAPYVEEEPDGSKIQKNPQFWSVWKLDDNLFLKISFPGSERVAMLAFSLNSRKWNLVFDSGQDVVDPLEYPLDGLILYYLSVINSDILIHASGVNFRSKGYIFSGISGKGKTTISGLWKEAGARVIHDDRLILRKTLSGYMMYNTPIYPDEEPSASSIDKIFLIDHGAENKMTRVNGAGALSHLLTNCIQHNWNPEIIAGLLSSVGELCNKVPVYRLSFKPDSSVTDYIIENG